MNSVANGKIKNNTKFKNVFIQAAAGDAGGAIRQHIYTIMDIKIKKENFR